jgi:hypothetical protein
VFFGWHILSRFRLRASAATEAMPYQAFFLKLDLAIVLISLMCVASPTAAPRQASVAESSVALPPVSVESRHAVSHALNPRHRMPAASTGQHAGPSMPLLRRYHAAPPDDPKTWSAFGTVHLRLPFLRTRRNVGSSSARGIQPSALSECRKINSGWGIPSTRAIAGAKLQSDFLVAKRNP